MENNAVLKRFHLSLLFPQRYFLGIFSGYLVPEYFSNIFFLKYFYKNLVTKVIGGYCKEQTQRKH